MAFSALDYIKEKLGGNQAFLVSSPANRFYLTGFETSAGYVVVTKKEVFFLVDSRYFEKAKAVVKSARVILSSAFLEDTGKILAENKITELFVEPDFLSLKSFENTEKKLSEIKVLKAGEMEELLLELRAVKGENELAKIKEAQALTDKTLEYILPRITGGRTEKEIMLDMEFFMRSLGADSVAFDFIVVSGKNSSLPHGVPTDKKIEKGDFITMDFGATVGGYRSDMTRTVALGSVTDEQRLVYDTVLKAQAAALREIRAGRVCCDIDKIARDIIYGAGFEGAFGHALGHSVGIEIHEGPNFSPRCKTVLRYGNVMTVEPGIYLENKFGVRIEDMAFVTEQGCENLTKSTKELIIL